MKQVKSSLSVTLWDENQKSPYYNYKVRLFTSYGHLFLLVFVIAYFHNYLLIWRISTSFLFGTTYWMLFIAVNLSLNLFNQELDFPGEQFKLWSQCNCSVWASCHCRWYNKNMHITNRIFWIVDKYVWRLWLLISFGEKIGCYLWKPPFQTR